MGMSLKDALNEARALGCTVEILNRTGEVAVIPPNKGEKRLRINNRRKDAPDVLLILLKRLNHERIVASIDQECLAKLLEEE